ncbi:unnamed protein product, partial [Symbiodinium sp. CCMP2456]
SPAPVPGPRLPFGSSPRGASAERWPSGKCRRREHREKASGESVTLLRCAWLTLATAMTVGYGRPPSPSLRHFLASSCTGTPQPMSFGLWGVEAVRHNGSLESAARMLGSICGAVCALAIAGRKTTHVADAEKACTTCVRPRKPAARCRLLWSCNHFVGLSGLKHLTCRGCSDEGATEELSLQMEASLELPPSLLFFFNAKASEELPIFRIPSKQLVEAGVPVSDIKDVWQRDLLWALPIGTESTFPYDQKERWLEMALEDDCRDVLLSPRCPQLTPELLRVTLRHFSHGTPTSQDLQRFGKATWGLSAGEERWRALAEQLPDTEVRQGWSKGGITPWTIRFKGKTQPNQDLFEYEDFTFAFLQRVNLRCFFSVGSLAESMFHYGQQPDKDAVSLQLCHDLAHWACHSNLKNRQDISEPKLGEFGNGAVRVQLGGPVLHVLADKTFWKAAGLEYRERKRLGVVGLTPEDVLPTRGSQAAQHCHRSYAGSFARELCHDHEKGVCQLGEACRKIHRKLPHAASRSQQSCSAQGLTDQNCPVEDEDLRSVFWEGMMEGKLRLSLQVLKHKLLQKKRCSEKAVLHLLASELEKGHLVVIVAAARGDLATEWNLKDWRKPEESVRSMKESRTQQSVQLLFSPSLREPPKSLLVCLLEYFRLEQLSPTVTHLRNACASVFALEVPPDGWRRLAKEGGFRCSKRKTIDGQTLWWISSPGKRGRVKWQASSCTKERQAALLLWVVSFDSWPSMGVLLESARLFGPDFARLPVLYTLLRAVAGRQPMEDDDEGFEDSETLASDEGEEHEEEGEDEEEEEGDEGPKEADEESHCGSDMSGSSEGLGERHGKMFPPCMKEVVRWPPRRTPQELVRDTFANWRRLGEKINRRGLKGRRVIKLKGSDRHMRKIINKLEYDLPQVETGQDAIDVVAAEDAEALLHAAGMSESVIQGWVRGEPFPRDVLVAMVVAEYRRLVQPDKMRPESDGPTAQEMLAALLHAKGLSHGQGRSHRIRQQILGPLRKHPELAGRIHNTSRGGSIGMFLDTPGSDHDIFLHVKDGGSDMVETVHRALKDLQQQASEDSRLARATVVRKDFAVGLIDYYHRDYDLVPVTNRPDLEGDYQWDPCRQVWQPVLHQRLAPKLQELSESNKDAFFVLRALKFWNEALPPVRGSETCGKKKAPLISVHIPLLVLAAEDRGRLDSTGTPQAHVLATLHFVKENWRCPSSEDATLREVDADPHLRRITNKYTLGLMNQCFPELLHAADRVVTLMRSFFHCPSMSTCPGDPMIAFDGCSECEIFETELGVLRSSTADPRLMLDEDASSVAVSSKAAAFYWHPLSGSQTRHQRSTEGGCADPFAWKAADGPARLLCTGGHLPLFRGHLAPGSALAPVGAALAGRPPPWASSGDRWAPEALEVNESLNVLVFCDKQPSGEHRIGWALAQGSNRTAGSWSRYAEGPLDLGGSKGGDIDPHLFRDADGTTYLLWKTDDNRVQANVTRIWMQRCSVTDSGISLVGRRAVILDSTGLWWVDSWVKGGSLVEGPEMVRQGGWYFLFFAAGRFCQESYAEGVARSRDIWGPYEKLPIPLLSTGIVGWDASEGSVKIIGPGHASFPLEPDGSAKLIVWHASAGHNCHRRAYVARIEWLEGDGGWPMVDLPDPVHVHDSLWLQMSPLPLRVDGAVSLGILGLLLATAGLPAAVVALKSASRETVRDLEDVIEQALTDASVVDLECR